MYNDLIIKLFYFITYGFLFSLPVVDLYNEAQPSSIICLFKLFSKSS